MEQQQRTEEQQQQQQAKRPRSSSGGEKANEFLRYNDFTKHFARAIYPFLNSCSREEACSYFAHFEPGQQDFLFKLYTTTAAEIHLNAAAEFKSICEETKVFDALNRIRNKELLGPAELSPSVCPREMVRELSVKRKQEEVTRLKQILQQTKRDNDELAATLEVLHAEVQEAREVSSVDPELSKNPNFNLMLGMLLEETPTPQNAYQGSSSPPAVV